MLLENLPPIEAYVLITLTSVKSNPKQLTGFSDWKNGLKLVKSCT